MESTERTVDKERGVLGEQMCRHDSDPLRAFGGVTGDPNPAHGRERGLPAPILLIPDAPEEPTVATKAAATTTVFRCITLCSDVRSTCRCSTCGSWVRCKTPSEENRSYMRAKHRACQNSALGASWWIGCP